MELRVNENKLASMLARGFKKAGGVWQIDAARVKRLCVQSGADPRQADVLGLALLARASVKIGALLGTIYGVRHFRRGRLIWEGYGHNQMTTEGVTTVLLGIAFQKLNGLGTVYVGLVENTGFSAYSAGDTAAKLTTGTPSGGTNGWAESEAYSGTNRIVWNPAAASGGAVSNATSAAAFSIDATDTIRGAFLTTSASSGTPPTGCELKGGGTGVSGNAIIGAGDFSAARSVLSGDVLSVTGTIAVTAS